MHTQHTKQSKVFWIQDIDDLFTGSTTRVNIWNDELQETVPLPIDSDHYEAWVVEEYGKPVLEALYDCTDDSRTQMQHLVTEYLKKFFSIKIIEIDAQ